MYGLKFNWLTGDMSDLELANQRLNEINDDISSCDKFIETLMLEHTRFLGERRKLKVDHANFLKSVAVTLAKKASSNEEFDSLESEHEAFMEKIYLPQILAKNDGLESKVSAEQVEKCVSMLCSAEEESNRCRKYREEQIAGKAFLREEFQRLLAEKEELKLKVMILQAEQAEWVTATDVHEALTEDDELESGKSAVDAGEAVLMAKATGLMAEIDGQNSEKDQLNEVAYPKRYHGNDFDEDWVYYIEYRFNRRKGTLRRMCNLLEDEDEYQRKHQSFMYERKFLNGKHKRDLYELLQHKIDEKHYLREERNKILKKIDGMQLERMFREDEKALSMTEGTELVVKNESESEKSALEAQEVLLMANATGSEAEQMRTEIDDLKGDITYLKDKINQLELKVDPSC